MTLKTFNNMKGDEETPVFSAPCGFMETISTFFLLSGLQFTVLGQSHQSYGFGLFTGKALKSFMLPV